MDETELERARQVHYAFLPEGYGDETLEVAVRAVPHGGLGGDYCGIEPLTDGRVALTVSDATGHDIASALFAARINTYVLNRITRTPSPCRLIASLNAFLFRRVRSAAMHATFCVAILDPRQGSWEFSGAGHPPAIHYRAATNDTALVLSQTTMVGAFETLPVPCGTTTSKLEAGDLILLFTDGLTDVQDGEAEPFGLERLQACAIENAERPCAELNDALFAAAMAHGGGRLGDDALLLTARRRRGTSA